MTEARVPVTVEDREAAASWIAKSPYDVVKAEAEMIRLGYHDGHGLVEAFTAHRLAGVAAGREEAAKVCDELADTAAMIQCAIELHGHEAPIKAAQREASTTLAAAIRQMGGE